jgi:hypothetical protein
MNQHSYLRRRLDIPLEQNKAPRPLGTDEFALGSAQFKSGYPSDEGPLAHQAD